MTLHKTSMLHHAPSVKEVAITGASDASRIRETNDEAIREAFGAKETYRAALEQMR